MGLLVWHYSAEQIHAVHTYTHVCPRHVHFRSSIIFHKSQFQVSTLKTT